MSGAQKLILVALAVVGLIFLLVGFTLMHHIGGFMRTVEEEARAEDDARDAPQEAPPEGGDEENK